MNKYEVSGLINAAVKKEKKKNIESNKKAYKRGFSTSNGILTSFINNDWNKAIFEAFKGIVYDVLPDKISWKRINDVFFNKTKNKEILEFLNIISNNHGNSENSTKAYYDLYSLILDRKNEITALSLKWYQKGKIGQSNRWNIEGEIPKSKNFNKMLSKNKYIKQLRKEFVV